MKSFLAKPTLALCSGLLLVLLVLAITTDPGHSLSSVIEKVLSKIKHSPSKQQVRNYFMGTRPRPASRASDEDEAYVKDDDEDEGFRDSTEAAAHQAQLSSPMSLGHYFSGKGSKIKSKVQDISLKIMRRKILDKNAIRKDLSKDRLPINSHENNPPYEHNEPATPWSIVPGQEGLRQLPSLIDSPPSSGEVVGPNEPQPRFDLAPPVHNTPLIGAREVISPVTSNEFFGDHAGPSKDEDLKRATLTREPPKQPELINMPIESDSPIEKSDHHLAPTKPEAPTDPAHHLDEAEVVAKERERQQFTEIPETSTIITTTSTSTPTPELDESSFPARKTNLVSGYQAQLQAEIDQPNVLEQSHRPNESVQEDKINTREHQEMNSIAKEVPQSQKPTFDESQVEADNWFRKNQEDGLLELDEHQAKDEEEPKSSSGSPDHDDGPIPVLSRATRVDHEERIPLETPIELIGPSSKPGDKDESAKEETKRLPLEEQLGHDAMRGAAAKDSKPKELEMDAASSPGLAPEGESYHPESQRNLTSRTFDSEKIASTEPNEDDHQEDQSNLSSLSDGENHLDKTEQRGYESVEAGANDEAARGIQEVTRQLPLADKDHLDEKKPASNFDYFDDNLNDGLYHHDFKAAESRETDQHGQYDEHDLHTNHESNDTPTHDHQQERAREDPMQSEYRKLPNLDEEHDANPREELKEQPKDMASGYDDDDEQQVEVSPDVAAANESSESSEQPDKSQPGQSKP